MKRAKQRDRYRCEPRRRLLVRLAVWFARGETTWRQIADRTNAAFGDLLLVLGRQGLALPRAAASKTPKQAAIWEYVLQRAASPARGADEPARVIAELEELISSGENDIVLRSLAAEPEDDAIDDFIAAERQKRRRDNGTTS